MPALFGILEIRDHDLLENLLMHRGILQRAEDFDTPVEVARHHVGGRDIHSSFCAWQALSHPEAVDSAMFEEAADDRFDPDVLRKAGNAGPQAANSAHHQFDRHTGLRGFIQRVDDIRLVQMIPLNVYGGWPAVGGMAGLAANMFEHALAQCERLELLFVFKAGLGPARVGAEHPRGVAPDDWI